MELLDIDKNQKTKLFRIEYPIELTFTLQKKTFFLFFFIQILPSSDFSWSQLKNKSHYNFWCNWHRLKIQKAKLVRIKFHIELSNSYFTKRFFIKLFLQH